MPRRGGHGERYGDGAGRLSREVQVSKKLSWLLRHGAEKDGLKLGPGGYANVAEVVSLYRRYSEDAVQFKSKDTSTRQEKPEARQYEPVGDSLRT